MSSPSGDFVGTMFNSLNAPLVSFISPLSMGTGSIGLLLASVDHNQTDSLASSQQEPVSAVWLLANPASNPADLGSGESEPVNAPNNPSFLLPPSPGIGFLNYEYSLRYQVGDDVLLPEDEVGGVSIAQFFDPYYYLNENPDLAEAFGPDNITAAYEHFLADGLDNGRDASPLFDAEFYLDENSDVAAAVDTGEVSSALAHFLNDGHKEGRDPSPFFKQSDYLLVHSEAADDIALGLYQSAFEHYVEEGADAGLWSDNTAIASVFDRAFYLDANPDVEAAVDAGDTTAFGHFVTHGQSEFRDPNAFFDLADYAAMPTVQADIEAGLAKAPFEHYVKKGRF